MGVHRLHAWTFYLRVKRRPGKSTGIGPTPSDLHYTNFFRAAVCILDLSLHQQLPVHKDFRWVISNMSWAEWTHIFGIIAYERFGVCLNEKQFLKRVVSELKKVINQDPNSQIDRACSHF